MMNTLQVQNPQREFVWVISKADAPAPKPTQAPEKKENELPSAQIQTMIEESIQQFTSTWLDKIAMLEAQISVLKNENLALQKAFKEINVEK